MFRKLLVFCFLFLLTACNCQKSADTDSKKEKEISSENIKAFLREKNFEIIATADIVVVYDIKKTEISSRKVFLKDTLEYQKTEELLTLLKDDSSYNWTSQESKIPFDATCEILVKNGTQRIFLLVDEDNMKLGFINLEGQKIVKLASSLSDYLKKL